LSTSRQLIINADDFGFTRDVNEGIVEAHEKGILTSTTLMANGEAFVDAVHRARNTPTLDVGAHLVLVGGDSLIPPYQRLPATVPELLAAIAARRLRIYDELVAQVRRILAAGIPLSHLDTHKHTHLLPPVLDAVARIAREFGIPWVRRPFDFPMGVLPPGVSWLRRTSNDGLRFLRKRFDLVLARHGCRTTDHFAGFQLTGLLRTRELARLIRSLPPGLTEFMCHPGRCGEDLQGAPTRLKESRERELEALLAQEAREALREAQVELIAFPRLEPLAG